MTFVTHPDPIHIGMEVPRLSPVWDGLVTVRQTAVTRQCDLQCRVSARLFLLSHAVWCGLWVVGCGLWGRGLERGRRTDSRLGTWSGRWNKNTSRFWVLVLSQETLQTDSVNCIFHHWKVDKKRKKMLIVSPHLFSLSTILGATNTLDLYRLASLPQNIYVTFHTSWSVTVL